MASQVRTFRASKRTLQAVVSLFLFGQFRIRDGSEVHHLTGDLSESQSPLLSDRPKQLVTEGTGVSGLVTERTGGRRLRHHVTGESVNQNIFRSLATLSTR